LKEPDKTLDDLLTMGRALEKPDAQSLTMERDSVKKVHTTQRSQPLMIGHQAFQVPFPLLIGHQVFYQVLSMPFS
jgi:hypothetical protein